MNCILNRGWKLNCDVSGGVDTLHFANHVKGNAYVKDTGDAGGSYTVVADNGDGTVTITATNGGPGHDIVKDQLITLSGGSYDGNYEVLSVPTTTTFVIKATFTATDAATWSSFEASNIIIGTSTTNGTALTFFEFEQDLEKAECVENEVIENGSVVYEQMVTMEIYGSTDQAIEDTKRTLVDELIKGRFVVVGEDNNGVEKVYGAINGLKFTDGDGGPGQAFNDLNGNVLTFTAREPEPAFLYDRTGDSSGTPAEAFTPFTIS